MKKKIRKLDRIWKEIFLFRRLSSYCKLKNEVKISTLNSEQITYTSLKIYSYYTCIPSFALISLKISFTHITHKQFYLKEHERRIKFEINSMLASTLGKESQLMQLWKQCQHWLPLWLRNYQTQWLEQRVYSSAIT